MGKLKNMFQMQDLSYTFTTLVCIARNIMTQKARPSALRQEFFSCPELPWLEIRSTFESAQPYALHCHQTFSVGLILRGKTRFLCDGAPYVAEEGNIVLIEPGVAHQCNPVEGVPRSYHMLHMDRSWIASLLQISDACVASIRVPERIVRDKTLAARITDAVDGAKRKEDGAFVRLEEYLAVLFSTRCSVCYAVTPSSLEEETASEPDVPLNRDGTRAPVAESAKRAGVRRETFIRSFRKKKGLSPGVYRHCLLLDKGRKLLRSGMGIAETAQALGYYDQSHFHRMFVKYLCATPRQYVRGRRSLLSKK